jgi:hypothetical protein
MSRPTPTRLTTTAAQMSGGLDSLSTKGARSTIHTALVCIKNVASPAPTMEIAAK